MRFYLNLFNYYVIDNSNGRRIPPPPYIGLLNLMGRRLRRQLVINPTLDGCLVFAWILTELRFPVCC